MKSFLVRSLFQVKLLRKFSTGSILEGSSQQSRQRLIEFSKECFPKLTSYPISQQIRIMQLFAKYEMREPVQFDKSQQTIGRNIKNVLLTELIILLQALFTYHRRYDPHRIIFVHINKHLQRMKDVPLDQLLQLMNILAKLEWSGKTINHVVAMAISKYDSLDKLPLQQTVKITLLLAQRSDASLVELAILVECAHKKLQQATISKLTTTDIALVYNLLFSDFLVNRVGKIMEYYKASSIFRQVLGSSSADLTELTNQRSRILTLIETSRQSKVDFEGKLVRLNPKFTSDELTIMGKTTNLQLKGLLQQRYKQIFMQATPIEFMRLLQDYGEEQQLHQYLAQHQQKMSLNEILYVLQRTHSILPKANLHIYMLPLLLTTDELNSKQFEWMVKLAASIGVPTHLIDAFIGKFSKQ